MKRKLVKVGTSYGVIIPSTLLELMGADMKKLNMTIIDIDYNSAKKQIILKEPTVVEKQWYNKFYGIKNGRYFKFC